MVSFRRFQLNRNDYETYARKIPGNQSATGQGRKGAILVTHLFTSNNLDASLLAFFLKNNHKAVKENKAADYQVPLTPFEASPSVSINTPFLMDIAQIEIKEIERLKEEFSSATGSDKENYEAILLTPALDEFQGDSYGRIRYNIGFLYLKGSSLVGDIFISSGFANPSPPRNSA